MNVFKESFWSILASAPIFLITQPVIMACFCLFILRPGLFLRYIKCLRLYFLLGHLCLIIPVFCRFTFSARLISSLSHNQTTRVLQRSTTEPRNCYMSSNENLWCRHEYAHSVLKGMFQMWQNKIQGPLNCINGNNHETNIVILDYFQLYN